MKLESREKMRVKREGERERGREGEREERDRKGREVVTDR